MWLRMNCGLKQLCSCCEDAHPAGLKEPATPKEHAMITPTSQIAQARLQSEILSDTKRASNRALVYGLGFGVKGFRV